MVLQGGDWPGLRKKSNDAMFHSDSYANTFDERIKTGSGVYKVAKVVGLYQTRTKDVQCSETAE